ncbi:MAG: T9SS type A sorting domain-containing protein [Bacteroidales bacterium]
MMKSLFIPFLAISCLTISAQQPVVLVDINVPDRQEAEVNEPGYVPWPIVGGGESILIDGVTFALQGDYTDGWYKAGVQAPYYARLANDGLVTADSVTLTISGLLPGVHSLLTFHNTFDNPDNNTFSPMNIYLNGEQGYDRLVQSNRVTDNAMSTTSYLVFEVTGGESIRISFTPERESDATLKIATLCGFELNTPNAAYQASTPFPAHGDRHARADSARLELSWTPAPGAVSHDVYVGLTEQSVAEATPDSAAFRENGTDTVHVLSDLYSMQDYYWRIDEHDSTGLVTRGDVWRFRPRQVAFPGAEGYGRYAIGGRGGIVVEVTNLEDEGPGSLREAVESDLGPRTIVFRVSGIITLKSRLTLNHDDVTVAGQTAPGKGICIRQAPFGLSGAGDVIVRNIRVRLGSGTTYDGMGMTGSDHSILDHCSISWTIDEGFSSRNGKHITLQRTLISEALHVAGHSNYPPGTGHGFAASIGGDIGSFHHNLLAHCAGRNWSLAGGLDGNGFFAGRLDIFNNVVYNWNYRVTDGGAHQVNFVGNYYKPGAAWDHTTTYALKAEYESFPGTQQYYFTGNIMGGVFDGANQAQGRIYTGNPDGYSPWVYTPFFPSEGNVQPVRLAYKCTLSDVGATQPLLDDHDIRVIRETLDSTFTFRGSYTNLPGIPDSEQDVGGWEAYPAMIRDENWDTDHDGMPDWWEKAHGLNPESTQGDFSESNADPDLNGYTHLEEYLNWLAEPHYFTLPGSALELHLPSLFSGFTDQPVYHITGAIQGEAVLMDDTLAKFTPAGEGLGLLQVRVEDAVGDSLTRTIGIYSGFVPADSLIQSDTSDPSGIRRTTPFDIEFTCFPNPAGEELFLQGDFTHLGEIDLKISTLTGETIRGWALTPGIRQENLRVDLALVPPGMYIISLVSGKYRGLKKFVKF